MFARSTAIMMFAILTAMPLLSAATYYVAPDGSDTNPGTIDAPFATIQRAHDHAAFQAGDIICLRGGTYFPGDRTVIDKAGTAQDFCILRSFPGELPVIDGGSIPEGDTNGGSNATLVFMNTAYWKVEGPIRVTNGRGAGVYLQGSRHLELDRVESSYNGQTAARAGHGFFIYGESSSDLLFRNCDSHHNANHLWRSGEDQLVNQYQHGDGWRIFHGVNIRLVGCRAWHNLDDGYDFTQAEHRIEMVECWAAYSGVDDAQGSITGTPNRRMRRWEGDGIKLGYENDVAPHRTIRCLSWNNNSHGWTVRAGPYSIHNCAAYNNVESAFAHIENNPGNDRRNTFGYANGFGNGGGAEAYAGLVLTAADFVSLDDAGMLGPRRPDGGLPSTGFLKPAAGGALVDAGVDVGLSYLGTAPDIGAFEHEMAEDTTPPIIHSIAVPAATELTVVFSEPVTLETAEDASNYSLSEGASVAGASLAGDQRTVTLTTSALAVGVDYTLGVNGVLDTSSNANPANDSAVFRRSLFAPWVEDFEADLSDGDSVDTGLTAWSTFGFDEAAGGEDFAVSNGRFESHKTVHEATWRSELIDISTAGSIDLSVDLISSPGPGGLESSDYLRTFYRLNGGGEVQVSEHLGQIPGDFANVRANGLRGDSVQIIIRTRTGGYNERYLWDNVRVTESPAIPGTTFAAWFSERTGSVPAMNEDADGDLIPALLEYAFDLDPLFPDGEASASLPELVTVDGALALLFKRFDDRRDLVYEVQSSDGLSSWTTIARSTAGGPLMAVDGSAVQIQETGSGEIEVEVTESLASGAAGFRRLRIAQIP